MNLTMGLGNKRTKHREMCTGTGRGKNTTTRITNVSSRQDRERRQPQRQNTDLLEEMLNTGHTDETTTDCTQKREQT